LKQTLLTSHKGGVSSIEALWNGEIHENYGVQKMNLRDNLRVMVVDDDQNTVDVFSEFLELSGVKVVGCAYDGKEAVELYNQLKPDIVFLDIMMPNYDGFYALEHIRKINPHAIVVMVTADLKADTAIKIQEMEATAVVYKPFDIQQLIEMIDKIALEVVK